MYDELHDHNKIVKAVVSDAVEADEDVEKLNENDHYVVDGTEKVTGCTIRTS